MAHPCCGRRLPPLRAAETQQTGKVSRIRVSEGCSPKGEAYMKRILGTFAGLFLCAVLAIEARVT